MGEVAEMFDVNASLLRHWESQFSVIRPKRNKKGNRLFTPADVENLKLIYHLVKEQGMTLEGAKKALKQHQGNNRISREMELQERLQRVRAMLLEVREELKSTPEDLLTEKPADDTPRTPRRKTDKAVIKIVEEGTEESKATTPKKSHRKKKDNDGTGELFAFYEQSLF